MNKSRLMTQYKELYGGYYIRDNGRWYWKANETTKPVLVMAGNLAIKIKEYEEKKSTPVVSTPVVEKKEENFSPLPQVAKKPAPAKKKKEETAKVEETKTETTE